MSTKKILCCYHAKCLDGIFSAWVVCQHFGFDQVEFLACSYNDPVPELKNREVYIVDFSFKPKVLLPLMRHAKSITMIDHHVSAIKEWLNVTTPPNFTLVKDTSGTVSGAGLTWKYFNKLEELPRLLRHVQDWDTWQFEQKKDGTEEIIHGLKARGLYSPLDRNFKELSELVRSSTALQTLREEGRIVLQYNKVLIDGWIEEKSTLVELDGYYVPMINVPHEFASKTGHVLSKGYPFSITYEDDLTRGVRVYSLRSDKVNGVEVNAIAQRYGGGGHPNAAGFTLDIGVDPGGLNWLTDDQVQNHYSTHG